jgi:hypothetical protein
MAAQRIALVLATGQVIDDVVVASGEEVVSVAGHQPRALPLYAVVDVIDRSDKSEGR